MAITLSLAITSPGSTRAGQRIDGVLTLTNDGANTIEVRNLVLSEQTSMGVKFRQPCFLTPNVALGVGEPDVTASSTVYYPFSMVVPSPSTPGAPAQAPNAMHDDVCPPGNTWCVVQLDARTYDSVAAAFVVGSTSIGFPVISAAQALISQGGAFQFNAAMNAVNFFL